MSDGDSSHRHKLAAGKDPIGNGDGEWGVPLFFCLLLGLLLVQQFGLQSIIEIDLGLWQ